MAVIIQGDTRIPCDECGKKEFKLFVITHPNTGQQKHICSESCHDKFMER